VAIQALEDVLRKSDRRSPVISELPFTKARDVSFCYVNQSIYLRHKNSTVYLFFQFYLHFDRSIDICDNMFIYN